MYLQGKRNIKRNNQIKEKTAQKTKKTINRNKTKKTKKK